MLNAMGTGYQRSKSPETIELLMNAVRVYLLGQITNALFAVGGQYRRSM